MAESEREMAERLVREATIRIERQRELIDDLRVAGALNSVGLAEVLLESYVSIRAAHVERLNRIMAGQ